MERESLLLLSSLFQNSQSKWPCVRLSIGFISVVFTQYAASLVKVQRKIQLKILLNFCFMRSLLTITDHYWPLLTVTDRYWPLLTITDRYWPLLTFTDRYWPLLTVTDHYYPLLTITDHYRPLPTITDHYWPLLTITDHYSHDRHQTLNLIFLYGIDNYTFSQQFNLRGKVTSERRSFYLSSYFG